MKNLPRTLAAAAVGGASILGLGGSMAFAQPEQQGLVNVALVDTTVQVPIAVAANVCDVSVNVLADQLALGDTPCGAFGTASAVDNDGGGGGPASQSGLVNIYASNTTIQVPVGIAANLCDINANVLAQQRKVSDTPCTAVADPSAET
jgi:hypothetical protein